MKWFTEIKEPRPHSVKQALHDICYLGIFFFAYNLFMKLNIVKET